MPKRTDLQSILILGSGPIVIGRAAEFDYSGTQAAARRGVPRDPGIGTPRRLAAILARTGRRSRTRTHDD
jgi:hypothetical protein